MVDEDLINYVRNKNLKSRDGSEKDIFIRKISKLQTEALRDVVDLFVLAEKISKKFLNEILLPSVSSLLVNHTDSLDEALNILEDIKKCIIQLDKDIINDV